ncbi:MAG: hypothetical protein IJU67_07170, partial [Lachnospiraceae bacterium]|nr:hypothetical protein [Lachnospiraceae bacterium]
TEFLLMYGELISYYQLIEMRLKGLCAGVFADDAKDWFKQLDEYQFDSFGLLIYKIKDIQNQNNTTVLDSEDMDALDSIRKQRNYWVHQCFVGKKPIIFNSRGILKNPEYAQKLKTSLDAVKEWDEKLTETFRSLRIQPPTWD